MTGKLWLIWPFTNQTLSSRWLTRPKKRWRRKSFKRVEREDGFGFVSSFVPVAYHISSLRAFRSSEGAKGGVAIFQRTVTKRLPRRAAPFGFALLAMTG